MHGPGLQQPGTGGGKEFCMSIGGAKTIAEYAIRRWLTEQGFDMGCFSLTIDGNTGTLEDHQGDSLVMVYDSAAKTVYIKED